MREQRTGRGRTALWLWLLAALGGSGLALVAILGLAVAVLGASFTGCEPGSERARARSGPGALGVCAAEHPARTPAALRAGRCSGSISTGAFSRRSGRKSATTASAPAQQRRGAPDRCRSPTSAAARAAPAPGRHSGNATPSTPTPDSRCQSTIRRTRSTPPRGFSAKTWAPRRPAAATRIPPGGVQLLRGVRDPGVSYAEEVMARAVQYGFIGAGSPAPTSPPLAHPSKAAAKRASPRPEPRSAPRSSRSPKARSGRASTRPARTARSTGRARSGARCSPPGCGSTPGCRCPGRPRSTGTPGRSTRGPENTAGRCSRRPRGPHPATPSSTGRAQRERACRDRRAGPRHG